MPTTMTSLLLFLALLLPGFIFLWLYTFNRPHRRLTVLQETGAVALVSIVADLVAMLVGVGVLAFAPGIVVIEVPDLIADPGEYFRAEYQLVTAWFIGILLVANSLAALGGVLARRTTVHPSVVSSWWTLFHDWQPDAVRFIQCELDNGSSVSGVLGDWNDLPDDSPDRDLILKQPITFRPSPDGDYQYHPVSAVCVPARRIVAMFVNYQDEEPTSPSSVAAEEAGSLAAALQDVGHARYPGSSAGPSDLD